jgi:hypothetical protein
MQRLRARLDTPIFDAAERDEADAHDVPPALRSDARVVVVLHQRLWGETAATRRDRVIIERRVAQQGNGFLVFVSLEPRIELPSWVAAAHGCTALSPDGVAEVEAITAAVERSGGVTRAAHASSMFGLETGTEMRERQEEDQSSFKMANLAQREVTALLDQIEKGVEELKARFPDREIAARRTPERCLIQAGDVALSVSWLRPAPQENGYGTLLVIEWAGTVTFPGEPLHPRHRATVVREHALHLETVAWPAWNWSADEMPLRKYTSSDLASLCLRQIAWQLDAR